MRRLSFVALVLVAAGLAACSSEGAAGWTYAPASASAAAPSGSASAAPSGSASAEPSASAAASPSASAAPSGSAAPSASAGGEALTVTAASGAATAGFEPDALEAPADTPFQVTFDNQDTTTGPHNWVLKDPSGAKVEIGDTAFFAGPLAKTYDVPALDAGAYTFVCEVHPTTMTGTLTVQ